MHLFFYARGIINQIEVWKVLMQGQFWKWKRKNLATGQEEFSLVQGALRPSVMGAWEYIFPEECLPAVLSIMGIADENIGATASLANKFKLAGLRVIFGADEIQKEAYEEARKIMPSLLINDSMRGLSHCIVPGVSIHTIGIKKDLRQDFVQIGYNQEML